MSQEMKELFETPAFRKLLALAALLTVLAFLDDVVMTVSFVLDGAYWAAAGRAVVFVIVGGTVALIWRAGQKHLSAVGEKAEEMAGADLHVVCEKHPPFGKVDQLGGVCMVCRFEKLDETAALAKKLFRKLGDAQRDTYRLAKRVQALEKVAHAPQDVTDKIAAFEAQIVALEERQSASDAENTGLRSALQEAFPGAFEE